MADLNKVNAYVNVMIYVEVVIIAVVAIVAVVVAVVILLLTLLPSPSCVVILCVFVVEDFFSEFA